MNQTQLKVWAQLIIAAMNAGATGQVSELYAKVAELATMEDAAQLEKMIAALKGEAK